jgi:hypothetical protein
MCRETAPPLEEGSPGHRWACWFPCEDVASPPALAPGAQPPGGETPWA